MANLNYKNPPPEECFNNWVSSIQWKIEILMKNGYTKDQAIELMKVYMLSDLESIIDVINNIG